MTIKYIRTLHIKYEINNQAEFISVFKLLEQEAKAKKLMILTANKMFEILEVGKPCGQEPIFSTDELDAVMRFLDSYEEL